MVVLFQFGYCILFNFLVKLIIRLEKRHQTVLLFLHHRVVLINRKVESSYQLSVFPGLVHVKLVVELAVTRQEIDNQCHSAHKQQ